MTETATSREALLEAACRIAEEHGLAALSVRGLAGACGVSVGTVYNHFPSKAALSVAAVELFFRRAFYEGFCHPAPQECFLAYCRRLHAAATGVLEGFRATWLKGAAALPEAEALAAHAREAAQLDHMLRGLEEVFAHDPLIDRAALPAGVDGPAVCRLVLDTLLGDLRCGCDETPTLLWALGQALYRDAGEGGARG